MPLSEGNWHEFWSTRLKSHTALPEPQVPEHANGAAPESPSVDVWWCGSPGQRRRPRLAWRSLSARSPEALSSESLLRRLTSLQNLDSEGRKRGFPDSPLTSSVRLRRCIRCTVDGCLAQGPQRKQRGAPASGVRTAKSPGLVRHTRHALLKNRLRHGRLASTPRCCRRGRRGNCQRKPMHADCRQCSAAVAHWRLTCETQAAVRGVSAAKKAQRMSASASA